MTSKFYKPKTTEEITKAFKEYDVDNSGSLCVKEIEQVMRNFRGKFIFIYWLILYSNIFDYFSGNITKSQFRELVNKADCDHNGLINISGIL